MADYQLVEITRHDRLLNSQMDSLLVQQGIRRDENLDYSCGLLDLQGNLIATGSSFASTLRCLAVDNDHRSEGLLNIIVSHLIERQYLQGNTHLFLYTKTDTARFFRSLGFHEIVTVPGKLVFMENQSNGFSNYLRSLSDRKNNPQSAAIVINGNPFTCGHQYLVEKAAGENSLVHLFVVSEDLSEIPAELRKVMISAGCRHLHNVVIHDCGPYLISSATFPSYFLKGSADTVTVQATTDGLVFARIAERLNITRRYFGEEPDNEITALYNQVSQQLLPEKGIECVIVPRLEIEGKPVSASSVRKALQENDEVTVRRLVPDTTYDIMKKSGLI